MPRQQQRRENYSSPSINPLHDIRDKYVGIMASVYLL